MRVLLYCRCSTEEQTISERDTGAASGSRSGVRAARLDGRERDHRRGIQRQGHAPPGVQERSAPSSRARRMRWS